MSSLRAFGLAAAGLCLLPACYHATVETGLTPSTVTLEQPFASAWIYGLVPPKTVQAAEKCSSGVAKVETQQSFLNGLVGALTLGIYTPMNIKVTCAAGGTALRHATVVSPAEPGAEALRGSLTTAARMAAALRNPVYVVMQ